MERDSNIESKDFRLIGIKVIEECDSSISKSLKIGEFYQFNNDFEIEYFDHAPSEIINVKLKKDVIVSESFYSSNDTPISISAIVGKNGSGKSTLLEILYTSAFLLGEKYGFIEEQKWKDKEYNPHQYVSDKDLRIAGDLERLKQISLFEIYYYSNNNYYRLINNGLIPGQTIRIEHKKENGGIIEWGNVEDESIAYSFYSICINYSLYGLNELDSPWIFSLFHKNDAYKTPLVINPYRRKGNIDVNNELHLAQTRTILNLTSNKEKFPIIVNKKKVSGVKFILDIVENDFVYDSRGVAFEFKNVIGLFEKTNNINLFDFFNKVSRFLTGFILSPDEIKELEIEQNLDFSFDVQKKYLAENYEDFLPSSLKVKYEIVKYTIRKLYKICVQYHNEYGRFLNGKIRRANEVPLIVDINGLLYRIKKDKSHITLKLRQIIYSFWGEFYNKKNWKQTTYYRDESKISYVADFNWSELSVYIENTQKKYNKKLNDRLEIVPVALFKPKIYIEGENKDEIYGFSNLSSGEQQLSNVLQTIRYHLYNLNSIEESKDDIRIVHKNINIIFDEVELYFHPDFQRIFISELLKAIKLTQTNNIGGINILFSTHSPFILSDISSSNVLRLKDGAPVNEELEETFAANIHDLLANDFFLKGGFMGEFAKGKINEIISFYNTVCQIKQSDISVYREEYLQKKENFDALYNIIGEPVTKTVIGNHISFLNDLFLGK